MITVSTSHAPSSDYFTRENYFESDVGVWFGGLARRLGLEGEPVRKRDFESLRFGLAPDGTLLLQNGGKSARDGRGTPHPLTQLVTNAWKDLSFLLALFPERRGELIKAHIDASYSLVRHVERLYSFVRLGKGGKQFARAEICVAMFLHVAARDGAPHLHSHLVVMPAGLAADGKTRRIAERVLFRAQKSLSALYDAELSKNLRALGLNTIPLEVGFRIAGVPEEGRRLLSTRRAEIVSAMEARGLAGARNAERVTKLTRRYHPKEERSPEAVFEHGRAVLEEAGFTRERLRHEIFPEQARVLETKPSNREIVERAARRLPEDRPFTQPEVEYQIAKEASRFGLGLATVVELASKWLLGSAVSLVSERPTRHAYVRAEAFQEIETRLDRLLEIPSTPLSNRALRRATEKADLAEHDRDVVASLLGDGSRIRLLIAAAGPEKERLLASIAATGVSTLGLSLTAERRDELTELGFEKSFTVGKAVREWRNTEWQWTPFVNAPHRHPIERIDTSPLQDELAAGFGVISRAEQRYRAWERSRDGLDLRGSDERLVVVDGAGALDPASLSRILREAERGGRNSVILCASPSDRFLPFLSARLEPVELLSLRAREQQLLMESLQRRGQTL